ncbi:MAG TPA: gephyrin-like molybdotransferase Glp [Solirubrobacteraceae bacterium]|jgi:molybdopterin molybdotransferase|nr:gephyrin-like molybdotransferase Glp [Solirubrobacteraceae bacterium]
MALLSIDDARARVLAAAAPLAAEDVGVGEALDRVLAQDVVAAADVPGFANSAMDGFAVRSGPAGRRLRIVGESRAGAPAAAAVAEGDAIRISTGALLPAGADAVLEVERVAVADGTVELGDDVAAGRNVRPPGDDLRAGQVVLRAGTRLGPAELGAAVGAGSGSLRCARRPALAIVATGDELRAPGEPLAPGQLHDSNGITLAALAARAGGDVVFATRAADTPEATRAAIGAALEADVVVLSGGVSVGPHDHVKGALDALGVREAFWRVALRPGKPTWFGTRDGRLVFGLPGNPVSSMVTFLLFVRPALARLQGAPAPPPRLRAELAVAVPRRPERDECVRVRLEEGRARPTGPQGSHQLYSMVGADGLAVIPAGEGELPAGAPVEVEPI